MPPHAEGRQRVIISGVEPEVESGRFPAKRTLGEPIVVEANVFADGHDSVACVILYRKASARRWAEAPMEFLGNDRWRGHFDISELGRYEFTIEAWIDRFSTWQHDLAKRAGAGQDVDIDLEIGARLAERHAALAGREGPELIGLAEALRSGTLRARIVTALSSATADIMARNPDRTRATRYGQILPVHVERERARYSAWYEMFPRSASAKRGKHGTFDDVIARLPYVAGMGFDVLYLPPIHPIGDTFRKGKNNAAKARKGDTGSPWAIGSAEGGHKTVHPELGALDDFRRLVRAAEEHGIEIALDIAFHCSPDHPYVREHPEWFRTRPDGSVQYAENPPKKYQDTYPFDFESEDWRGLWEELRSVFLFWIAQGVRVFRVDNPHTKPFAFWEWVIAEIQRDHPDVIFLSEAFTRPQVMYWLAKLGFSQSYTYFAWRNTKWELEQYFTDLTQTEVRDFLRPNLWPNTPDILTEHLQTGGRPVFTSRLVLAATLGASYGIYGPPFELMEAEPREPGSEEYLNSEKYEARHWDVERGESLSELIALINRIRQENPALQSDRSLRFHHVDNDEIICYSKATDDGANIIITIVSLDPHHTQSGWVDVSLHALGLGKHHQYQLHDLLTGARYMWHGHRNFVMLDPHSMPAHILRLHSQVRTEADCDYFA